MHINLAGSSGTNNAPYGITTRLSPSSASWSKAARVAASCILPSYTLEPISKPAARVARGRCIVHLEGLVGNQYLEGESKLLTLDEHLRDNRRWHIQEPPAIVAKELNAELQRLNVPVTVSIAADILDHTFPGTEAYYAQAIQHAMTVSLTEGSAAVVEFKKNRRLGFLETRAMIHGDNTILPQPTATPTNTPTNTPTLVSSESPTGVKLVGEIRPITRVLSLLRWQPNALSLQLSCAAQLHCQEDCFACCYLFVYRS